jgi:2-polyprenyl-3-methyl-5-hydroxy-6-metoxy-1,4-benzoquinol methylase
MSQTNYESELTEIWRRAVDPAAVGMPEAIAAEISSYTGEPVPLVLERMASGKDDLARLWLDSKIDATDGATVASFYRDQFVEAYELAHWHCGGLNGHPPLNYAHAAVLAQKQGLRRALDFGSGIGTGALCLDGAGCEVDCVDVSNTLLAFVGHRFEKRGRPVKLIDVGRGETPALREYDLITCFDVLEHIPDQQTELCRLQSYLRPGGYLVVNLMPDSHPEDRPMHVSSANDWLAMVRRTSMIPDWQWFRSGADSIGQALVYRRWGRLRNLAGSCVDRYQRSSLRRSAQVVKTSGQ